MSPVPASKRAAYRLTRYSIFWLLVIPTAIGYEMWAIVTGRTGGPLSHVMWWAYGDQFTLRWWLLGCAFCGFSAWCCWHFLFRWPDWPHLLVLVGLGLLAGLIGFLFTR